MIDIPKIYSNSCKKYSSITQDKDLHFLIGHYGSDISALGIIFMRKDYFKKGLLDQAKKKPRTFTQFCRSYSYAKQPETFTNSQAKRMIFLLDETASSLQQIIREPDKYPEKISELALELVCVQYIVKNKNLNESEIQELEESYITNVYQRGYELKHGD